MASPWPSLAGGQNPPERHALREIARLDDLAHVNGQAYLVAPVSPATLDTLAAFEAEAEDREDAPAEGQDDDELSIVSVTWARCRSGPLAARRRPICSSGANSPETRGQPGAATAPRRPQRCPDTSGARSAHPGPPEGREGAK